MQSPAPPLLLCSALWGSLPHLRTKELHTELPEEFPSAWGLTLQHFYPL